MQFEQIMFSQPAVQPSFPRFWLLVLKKLEWTQDCSPEKADKWGDSFQDLPCKINYEKLPFPPLQGSQIHTPLYPSVSDESTVNGCRGKTMKWKTGKIGTADFSSSKLLLALHFTYYEKAGSPFDNNGERCEEKKVKFQSSLS